MLEIKYLGVILFKLDDLIFDILFNSDVNST